MSGTSDSANVKRNAQILFLQQYFSNMKVTPKITGISRAIQAAEGILKGVAADRLVTQSELEHLKLWLDQHANLADIVPFSEAYSFIESAHKNADLDPSAIDEFLEFCQSFTATNGPIDSLTADMRRLHGILHGIAADQNINVAELEYLRSWLTAHSMNRSQWPVKDLYDLLDSILADGVVTQAEQEEVLTFCRDFAYQFTGSSFSDNSIVPPLPSLATDAPVVESIFSVADSTSQVQIPERSFCFTGQMRAGKRKDIEKEVETRDGKCASGISKTLDYLVIGADSNPCWTYATYGRKIEKVMANRENGAKTIILLEGRFLEYLRPE